MVLNGQENLYLKLNKNNYLFGKDIKVVRLKKATNLVGGLSYRLPRKTDDFLAITETFYLQVIALM